MWRLFEEKLPSGPGTYLLWFDLESALDITAGGLGPVRLNPGSYIYVGSALGSGGLRSRLGRHMSSQTAERRLHWHIDYLTSQQRPVFFRYRVGLQRLECAWIGALCRAGAVWPQPGFGSSDCRSGCPAHFLSLPSGWTLQTIEDYLT
ncbi:MAG: GIY-YIG nuclease family protein [Chloroflexota bacterium]|nr:GIY-YIG nuclease family protein [Chloroflexota bacterium]